MNCTICLDIIHNVEIDTSCGHQFHQKCLEKWLANSKKKNCPLCRQKISFKKISWQRNCLQFNLFQISSRVYKKMGRKADSDCGWCC